MKKTLCAVILFMAALSAFAQRIPTVGVLPFQTYGDEASAGDAALATQRLIAELSASETLSILSGAQAEGGEFIVRGQVSRQDGQTVLTATLEEAASGRILNTARSQGSAVGAIPMFAFAIQIADFIPFTNYLLGRWESTLQMIDGPVSAILEFRPGGVVNVEKYETWEHNGAHSLKYQAIGTGTYAFTGFHLRRTITAGGRSVLVHASLTINLTLEDALPGFAEISSSGLMLVFDEPRRTFELVNAGLPFGNNFTGPSVHPNERIYYRSFARL